MRTVLTGRRSEIERLAMSEMIRRARTYRYFIAMFVLAFSNSVIAGQASNSSRLRDPVMSYASAGQFDAADRAIEVSLTSKQPDYELFWEYLSFLVNESSQPSRAARLGQKWLPTVRRAAPPSQGRILKETALGILFGRYRESHLPEDRVAAKKLLIDAVEVNPQVCEAYIHLAMLESLEGQTTAALTMLDRSVETASDSSLRKELLATRDQVRQDPHSLVVIARRTYEFEK
jgi:hypothetical protein